MQWIDATYRLAVAIATSCQNNRCKCPSVKSKQFCESVRWHFTWKKCNVETRPVAVVIMTSANVVQKHRCIGRWRIYVIQHQHRNIRRHFFLSFASSIHNNRQFSVWCLPHDSLGPALHKTTPKCTHLGDKYFLETAKCRSPMSKLLTTRWLLCVCHSKWQIDVLTAMLKLKWLTPKPRKKTNTKLPSRQSTASPPFSQMALRFATPQSWHSPRPSTNWQKCTLEIPGAQHFCFERISRPWRQWTSAH